MKKLIILALVALPTFGFSQVDESKMWENAMYEVNHNGAQVFYTDIAVADAEPFKKEEMISLRETMYSKEGIFKVELMDLARVVRVYHFDYIELETLKNFVLPVKEKIEIHERVLHEF